VIYQNRARNSIVKFVAKDLTQSKRINFVFDETVQIEGNGLNFLHSSLTSFISKVVFLEKKEAQFLYKDNDDYVFIDTKSFENFTVPKVINLSLKLLRLNEC
jgi:translation elongation factor P/translation initiation factor 5A